mgnify:CR=1 FL=1
MRRFTLSGTANALDADGLANDVTLATSATLATTTVGGGDGLAHKVTVTGNAATNHSGKTITVTGTLHGINITDTMAGPNGVVAVTTAKYFDTVTAVSISSTAGADTFDIGWAVDSVTAWTHVSRICGANGGFAIGFGCHITDGSPTYSVQHCHGGSDVSDAFTHSTVTGETTDQEGTYTTPIEAFRLLFTAAGSVEMVGNWTE